MMIRKKLASYFVATVLVFVGVFAVVTTISPVALAAKCENEVSLVPGAKPWYSGLCKAGTNDIQISDPGQAAVAIGLNILGAILVLAGYVAVGYVIWGGFNYMTAAGDSGKISSAKTMIQNALIGLLIALSAVAIVTFIGGVYGVT